MQRQLQQLYVQHLQVKEPTENGDLVTQYTLMPRQQSLDTEKPYIGDLVYINFISHMSW